MLVLFGPMPEFMPVARDADLPRSKFQLFPNQNPDSSKFTMEGVTFSICSGGDGEHSKTTHGYGGFIAFCLNVIRNSEIQWNLCEL
jgi:hypothetical protein